jgi:hypothetical protein
MIAGIALSAASTAYGIQANIQAGKRAEEAAERNARNIAIQNERAVQQAKKEQHKKQSTARARVAAAGLVMEGSPQYYMEELKKTGAEDIRWLKWEGQRAVEAEREKGRSARVSARHGAITAGFKGLSSMVSQYGSYEARFGGFNVGSGGSDYYDPFDYFGGQ